MGNLQGGEEARKEINKHLLRSSPLFVCLFNPSLHAPSRILLLHIFVSISLPWSYIELYLWSTDVVSSISVVLTCFSCI